VLKAFAISAVVFIVMFAILAGLVILRTSDSRVLSQAILDKAMAQDAAPAPAAAASGPASAAPALDTSPPQASAPGTGSEGTIELYRKQARSELLILCGLAMFAGFIAAASWLVFIFGRAKEVVGILGSASGMGAWFGGFLAFVVLGALAGVYELKFQNLATILASEATVTVILLCFAVGAIGYYLSTAFGAPKLMRPSVPLLTLMIR